MRRTHLVVLSIVVLLGTLLVGGGALAAQDATPDVDSELAGLDLPTLEIMATDAGIEGFPEQLDAGRYLITLTVADNVEFGGGFELVQPSRVTAEEFLNAMMGLEDEPEVGALEATPVGETIATPPAEAGETDAPPQALYDARWAGGLFTAPGSTNQLVLDLTPGEWIVSTGDDAEPVVFEATGEMPTDLPAPDAGATITMGEYVIAVTEGELSSGSQTVRIDNIGAQPHFIGWLQGPDGLTEQQLEVALGEDTEAEMTGTPPAYSDFNPNEDTEFVVFTGTQSPGASMWVTLDVEAGTHILICEFPDVEDGIPHLFHGMYTIVEIDE